MPNGLCAHRGGGVVEKVLCKNSRFQYKEGGSSVSAVTFLMSSEVRTVFVCTLSIQNVTNLHVNKRTLSQKSYILFGKTAVAFTKLEQIQFEHLWFSQTSSCLFVCVTGRLQISLVEGVHR